MAQDIICLVVGAAAHDGVFLGGQGAIVVVVVVVDFCRVEILFGRLVLGVRWIRKGGALGVVFGLAEALNIFPSQRSAACVAHQTNKPIIILYIHPMIYHQLSL